MLRPSSCPRRFYLFVLVFLGLELFLLPIRHLQKSDTSFQYGSTIDSLKSIANLVTHHPSTSSSKQAAIPCDGATTFQHYEPDAKLRDRYGLSRNIVLFRQCIQAAQTEAVDRDVVNTIVQPLISPSLGARLTLDGNDTFTWHSSHLEPPISLAVPPPFPQELYPHLLFGVATSLARLRESLPGFAHWLADTDARLAAIIVDAHQYSDNDFHDLVAEYRHSGIDLAITRPWNPTLSTNEQHFTMVRDLVKLTTADTKWIAIIDDDTFFPSLYPLSKALDKHNVSDLSYLGVVSESYEAVEKYGYMAFGGAGAFLSVPLAEELNPWIEECLDEFDVPQGDWLLNACIREKTDVHLTAIAGLHQLDLMGDIRGFYESGRLPLSTHHWKTWHHAPMAEMAEILNLCGGCFLQRWRFGSDTILHNGYSIAVYDNGTEALDLSKMEATFERPGDYEWSLGPLRDKEDGRRTYLLVDTEWVGHMLRQVYICKAKDDAGSRGRVDDGTEEDEHNDTRDEVVELWWEVV